MAESNWLSLEDWARAEYGDSAPGIDTLRRWARDARISPAPEKHGRTYMVKRGAKYANAPRRRLVQRIKRDSAA